MPYFKWYALDEAGRVHRGTDFARSPELLTRFIKNRGLASLVACHAKARRVTVSAHQRAQFFMTMADLLQAGVRVGDALEVAYASCDNREFSLVIDDCRAAVQEGVSLGAACAFHEPFFTPLACQMLLAGQESGALPKICSELGNYFTVIDQFSQRVRSALLVPLITLIGFVLVLLLIFGLIIPRFAVLLRSFNKPLHWRTEWLVKVSAWFALWNPLLLLAAVVGIFVLAVYGMRLLARTALFEKLLLRIPYIGSLMFAAAAVAFFRTLGTLLAGGVPMVQALSFAVATVTCKPLAERYAVVAHKVQSGSSLTVALHEAGLTIDPASRAFIAVGEATGALGPLLLRCADYYQQKLYRTLELLTKSMQPVLLVLLGALVAFVIFSMYEPIFSLSAVVD